MPVPSSYNDVLVDGALHDHVGDVWYQRTVFVPRGWEGQRVVLRFDAATHRAAVWIDDTLVAEHEGGYTPFEADVSALSRSGRTVPADRGRQQRADVAVAPSRHRRGDARRPAAAAPVPRFLQLRRAPPRRVAVLHTAVPHRGHDGRDRARRRDGDRALSHHRPGGRGRGGPARAPGHRGERRGPCVRRGGRAAGDRCLSLAPWPRLPLRAVDRPHGRGPPGRPLRGPRRHPDRTRRRDALPHQRRTLLFRGFGKHEDLHVHGRGHDDASMVHDFALLGGSGPTRSGHRTTRTPRRSSTWPTAWASSSSTRRRPSASTWESAVASSSVARRRPSRRRPSVPPPRPSTCRPFRNWSTATRTTRASSCGVWPTSPSPIPTRLGSTSRPSSPQPGRPIPAGPSVSST